MKVESILGMESKGILAVLCVLHWLSITSAAGLFNELGSLFKNPEQIMKKATEMAGGAAKLNPEVAAVTATTAALNAPTAESELEKKQEDEDEEEEDSKRLRSRKHSEAASNELHHRPRKHHKDEASKIDCECVERCIRQDRKEAKRHGRGDEEENHGHEKEERRHGQEDREEREEYGDHSGAEDDGNRGQRTKGHRQPKELLDE
jgi:hypothetical protein